MKLEASILYEELLKDDAGMYVWIDPDESSLIRLARMVKDAPFKTKDVTEFHCTVLHAAGALPSNLEVPKDTTYVAAMLGFTTWTDHKQRTIVVLELQSSALSRLHKFLSDQGLKHAYPKFIPHITIAKNVELNAETRLWLSKANEAVANTKYALVSFLPQIKASPIV